MLSDAELPALVAALRAGGVVACATETWFGLLADANNPAAVERVSALKGRDPGMPIAVLLPNVEALATVTDAVDARVLRLAQRHWPGPLTLLVRALPQLPAALVKDGKIGVRVPGASPALQLVQAFGAPLTATSANLTGQPATQTAAEVARVFPVSAQGVAAIAGTRAPGSAASTIVDTTGRELVVLRQGPVTLAPDQ